MLKTSSTAATSAEVASNTTVSFLFKPLAPSIAQTRFKANAFGLFLLWFVSNIFTPYKTIRSGMIWFLDEKVQHRIGGQRSLPTTGFSMLEWTLSIILIWNIIEAGLALRYPTETKFVPRGMHMTPSKISSPLTRAYTPPSTNSIATPLPANPSNPAVQRLSTPSNNHNNTPSRLSASSSLNRSSPLSSSTAKILNLPNRDINSSPSRSNGLFFNSDDVASPSKLAQNQSSQFQPQTQPRPSGQGSYISSNPNPSSASVGNASSGSTTTDNDFVLVDRAEREWAENLWKGARGKGGKIGT